MRMELDKNEGALDKMWAQTERQNRELEEKNNGNKTKR